MTSRHFRVLAVAAMLSSTALLRAQVQAVARLDGEMLPILTYHDDYLVVSKNGKKRDTYDRAFEVRPANAFAEGRIEISDVQIDLDPLRAASLKERTQPSAIHCRFSAKIASDRTLADCCALLTFTSEGSVGTFLIAVGKLSAGSSKKVSAELTARVDAIGSLHVFSGGSEVRSNQHPSAYDAHAYFAELAKTSKGLSAAELLKYDDVYPHTLSRDGRLLATIRKNDGKKRLIVYDVESMKLLGEEVVAEADDVVADPTWVSDHEVAFIAEDDYRDRSSEWKLKLFDFKTGKIVTLLDDVRHIISGLPDQPEVLVISSYDYRSGSWWMNYNVRTRKASKIDEPSAGSYWFDRNGVARVMLRYDGDVTKYEFKATPTASWREIDDAIKQPGLHFNLRAADWLDRVVDFHGIGPDGDTLYVSTRLGTDRFELAAFSMSAGVIKRVIAKHPKYDLTTSDFGGTRLLYGKNSPQLLGIIFDAAKPQVVWVDPKFAAVQKKMDEALPTKTNLPIDWCDDGSAFVYLSLSDQDPGTYYVYRPVESKLIPVLNLGERLEGKTMASMTAFNVIARDNVKIPAYLTRPPEITGPAPLVVMVHGGPMARDSWSFDPLNQFLASRGYLVLQVNFRGSSGYGAAFQKAGLHARLDTVVLDDIADGVKQLIASGDVDPTRVAVMGASFGGWATYMSLIKYPELYRAGVAISAVSNWRKALHDDNRLNNKIGYKFWKALLGRENFAADERFIDPYLRAAELKQPIYIMHGELDYVVTASEAKMMLEALRKTNPHVLAHSFPNASHTYWPYAEHVMMFNEIARFLEQYVASPEPAAPKLAAATVVR
jgi:dipeptidyl aminopeptidase/acylaminoacyl peptidase